MHVSVSFNDQMQLEQEIDLILGQKEAVKAASHEWDTKWGPAIIELSETMTGKQATIYKQNQMASQGIYSIIANDY